MKAVAVIGPSQSGKSTLIEGIAHLEGARPQALNLLGGTRVTLFDFMDDPWAAIEVPGGHDAFAQVGPVLATCDAAVLCVAAQADAAVLAAPYLRLLERSGLPVFLFINKIDVAAERVSEIVASLQQYCGHGIVLRQVPIRDGDEITGAVDLISERAWEYHEDQRSSLIELPETMVTREQEARSDLLEAFADFDDALLEQIIEDQRPATDQVYSVATKVLRRHELVPALLGAAGHGNGLLRLMKSLRHEVPEIAALCKRLELPADTAAIACLADQWKHLGKLVLLRAVEGGLAQGARVAGDTIGALYALDARTPVPAPLPAGAFALAIKSGHIAPACLLRPEGAEPMPAWSGANPPAFRRILRPLHERDDGKLSTAMTRLAEIDAGLTVERDDTSGALIAGVQGDQHLKALVEKLADVFGLDVECSEVPAALRETIRGSTTVHHRHRKQSGGAGQFADVVIDVAPAPSGSGFAFAETIKGGAVPKNYIPAVEAGARDALEDGPAGYRVVDIAVTLRDGKSHSVDSSDYAFRTAGHNAVREALAKAGTNVLQPIAMVEIHVPSVFTGGLVQLVSGLKGQVLKFEAHPEADGWDVFSALLPMAVEDQLSRALGSATRGTAWFESKLDHYEKAHFAAEPA